MVAIIRRGKIILMGALANIKQELLGPVEYEARFAGPLTAATKDDLAPLPLPDGTHLTGRGDNWLRFCSEKPEESNAVILRTLLRSASPALVSFQEVGRSLEQVYIQAVHQADQEESYVG